MINLMEAQGYKFKDKVMFQDNMSAMKMEKNGRNSCTGNSRHYFFVKDRLDKKEFRLEYCPTGNMIADYFTKPLQGALFTKFRAVIWAGNILILFLHSEIRSVLRNMYFHVKKKKLKIPLKNLMQTR